MCFTSGTGPAILYAFALWLLLTMYSLVDVSEIGEYLTVHVRGGWASNSQIARGVVKLDEGKGGEEGGGRRRGRGGKGERGGRERRIWEEMGGGRGEEGEERRRIWEEMEMESEWEEMGESKWRERRT